MPARVEPTFTEEQTRSVVASASGMDAMSLRSASPMFLCTSAVKPPTKFTPTSRAALSMARAMGDRSSVSAAPAISAMGVTEMRLFTMGMPYSRSSCWAVGTSFSAAVVMRSYTLRAMASTLESVHPRRFRPSVMVRMSRFCSETMDCVSAISSGVICISVRFLSVQAVLSIISGCESRLQAAAFYCKHRQPPYNSLLNTMCNS